MICGIYKITNLINNKCYIGQSRGIEKRWAEHQSRAFNPNSESYEYHLSRAIRKYGLKNFSFEIIEECPIEKLNERERYWIQYYKSYDDTLGYNICLGGAAAHPQKVTFEQAQEIINLLRTTNISQAKIAKQYNMSQSAVSDINTGDAWYQEEFSYPLRPWKWKERDILLNKDEALIKFHNHCIDCGKEISEDAIRCPACDKIHQRKVERPSREILKQEIRTTPFLQLGKKYGVADNTIKKWCDYYKLPRLKSDINKYTDQEWQEI